MRARNAYAAPNWAAEQRLGFVGLKATLLILANYADENFSCYPGQQRIADETEQSERQVRRQLDILEEVGLISRAARYENGRRLTDRFMLKLDMVVTAQDVTDAKARIEARKGKPKTIPDTMSGMDSQVHTGHREQFIPDTGDSSYRTLDVRGTPSRTPSRTTTSSSLRSDSSSLRSVESPGSHESDPQVPEAQPALIAAPTPPDGPGTRQDVESLCNHLAYRIEHNGSKPPTITAGWRKAARLLLDSDRRDLTEAHWLIDWCQDDTFWQANILSMTKFRQKYDQLRLKARQQVSPEPRRPVVYIDFGAEAVTG